MKTSIRAAAIQFNISLGQVEVNLDRVRAALARVHRLGAQLAVLPEMWSTGYDYQLLAKCAAQTPAVIEQLCLLTAESGMVVVGSLPELQNDTIFNTAYVIDQGRLVDSYRKLHLFSTMREDEYLGAGDRAVVAETSLGPLGIAICYDLRFPELFRKLALEGAEIICIPAEWPKPRQEHWKCLLRARAIENQLFIVAANCCGIQGKLDFFGLSQLISPLGHILETAGETETELVTDFDFEEMVKYRAQIKTLLDRRPDIYGTP